MDTIEEIKKLKALLDQGAITTEEFDDLKKITIKENTLIPPTQSETVVNSLLKSKRHPLLTKVLLISSFALISVMVVLGIKNFKPIKETIADVLQQEHALKDIDGNVYKTITIGTQIWMAENLKTTRFNDGSAIPLVSDVNTWYRMYYFHSHESAYCWYNNDATVNKNIYGALYNWNVVSTNKLCPIGWHVPSDLEWTTLTNYLGGNKVAVDKIKEKGTAHWTSQNNSATNESGFTALPSGIRNIDGEFQNIGIGCFWWSATHDNEEASLALCRRLFPNIYDQINSTTNGMQKDYFDTREGLSVRCVRYKVDHETK